MANTTSKADEIVAVLRTEILTGQYRAGERLPSERDLAARFCANRGAIREAIKKLEQLGIAAVMPGGIRIVPVEEATLEVLGHLIDLDELMGRG
jgi:GntR family transcriptional repressor for pyruvate dehydrogenase complex